MTGNEYSFESMQIHYASADFTDYRQLRISDMEQYQKELEQFSFDKLCMIRIDNSDLLVTCLGGSHYRDHLGKGVHEIYEYMEEHKLIGILIPYIMDHATFLIAGKPEVSREVFLRNIRKLHKKFQWLKPDQTDMPILIRFAVTLNPSHMIECTKEALLDKRNIQKRFILCEDKSQSKDINRKELRIIGILQWAIQNNGVVPYYQGVYDNKRKCIEKYESLMRIIDSEGKVYTPAFFMDTAKKYHMYAALSEAMVRRVLKEVDDKPIAVSINLSAYDINSKDFQESLFAVMKQRKSRELLVFEILEDEAFEKPEILLDFVASVEQLGAKIAIDDFGSGYSNLLEIARMTPAYLKIDGNIIVQISSCARARRVMESILYLAQKIHTQTVAEYVENSEIQHYMEEYGVDFSQGYYHSLPLPMDSLQTMIDADRGGTV